MVVSINPAQVDSRFDELVTALDKVSQDPTNKGKGDSSFEASQDIIRVPDSYRGGVKREPWIMSTTEWLTGASKRAIVWYCNPASISWTMPQRSVHTKNLQGTVLHVWPDNNRNTFYDEFRVVFSLQSGNLLPVRTSDAVETIDGKVVNVNVKWKPSGGIANFFDFMQLVDAPKLTSGDNGAVARANLVSIQYSSTLFPSLTLLGMFEPSGIRFDDNSQNPSNVSSWSAEFLVYDSIPRLSDNSGQQSNTALLDKWFEKVKSSMNLGK